MCEPAEASSQEKKSVDFSEYMWMGEEELEDFDKKCEDEFWEDYLIQTAYEEMLADEEEKDNVGLYEEQGDGPHVASRPRNDARSNSRLNQRLQQQHHVELVERRMAELNVDPSKVHYQAHSDYPHQGRTQPKPRLHTQHRPPRHVHQRYHQNQRFHRNSNASRQDYLNTRSQFLQYQQQCQNASDYVPPPPHTVSRHYSPQTYRDNGNMYSDNPRTSSSAMGSSYYNSSACNASAAAHSMSSFNNLNPNAPAFVPGARTTTPAAQTVSILSDATYR